MNWGEYVPVHQRLKDGREEAQAILGKDKSLQPVRCAGQKIAKTFWGTSWCKHFESYRDYANRLPRGRTYARNGSIVHLEILSGKITAMVAGSDLYHIEIKIEQMPSKTWARLCKKCTSSVTSTIDLLQGKLPAPVLETLTNPKNDLFPRKNEIQLDCDCPDWAGLCKHLAAVLYGVGNRLDDAPELLFLLRGVDQNDLIGRSLDLISDASVNIEGAQRLELNGLEDIFGIELVDSANSKDLENSAKKTAAKATRKKTAKKKAVKKKAVKKKAVKKKAAKKKVVKKKAVKKKAVKKKVVKKDAIKRK